MSGLYCTREIFGGFTETDDIELSQDVIFTTRDVLKHVKLPIAVLHAQDGENRARKRLIRLARREF